MLGGCLAGEPTLACLLPLRLFLKDISQHPLQVVGGGGFGGDEPLTLPPLLTCQVTCTQNWPT